MTRGDLVTYIPFINAPEKECKRGKVKSYNQGDDFAFVVFNCNEEWDQWDQYTGQHTNVTHLKEGWPDEPGESIF